VYQLHGFIAKPSTVESSKLPIDWLFQNSPYEQLDRITADTRFNFIFLSSILPFFGVLVTQNFNTFWIVFVFQILMESKLNEVAG